MSPEIKTYVVESSNSTTTRLSPDIRVDGKRSNSYLEITGGHKCLDMSEFTSKDVTHAKGQNRFDNHQWASFIRCSLRKREGIRSVSILSSNCPNRTDTTRS